jgi:hypothetical protein
LVVDTLRPAEQKPETSPAAFKVPAPPMRPAEKQEHAMPECAMPAPPAKKAEEQRAAPREIQVCPMLWAAVVNYISPNGK